MDATLLVDQHGKPLRSSRVVSPRDPRRVLNLQAAYDAAQIGGRNAEHWKLADGLSSAAANSYSVRKTLRERARYEHSNNSFARGLARTLATDLVGTRVRVQFQSGDSEADRLLEKRLARWMKAVRLAKKLRTGRIMRAVDGESFFMRQYSPRLKDPVKTSIRLIECDYFDDPMQLDREDFVSGVAIDPQDGEPISYTMLKSHPGDVFSAWSLDTRTINADDLFHWFQDERGGQIRGVSEYCSSLSLYAQLRRWTLSTLDAAEFAASQLAVIETQAMPTSEDGGPDYDREMEAFDTLPFNHGQFTAMPRGYRMNQMKAEHPISTFEEFRNAVLDEQGRGQNAPSNKARGNSSKYNYASGRLDHQGYYEYQDCERTDLADEGLDKFIGWWAAEAVLVYPEFRDLDPHNLPDHVWYFDGHPHVDEVKHANATTIMVNAELIAEDDVLLAEGRDPEQHWAKIAAQRARRKRLDEIGPSRDAPPTAQPAEDDEDDAPGRDDKD